MLTALWGWFGWLLVAWVVCLALDVCTGMTAGLKKGEWSSRVARDGLWHKAGCVSAVTAAGVLDLVAGLLLGSLPADALPFSYTVLLCPLAVVWYLLTEMGSILENAGAMGAPIPGWLRKAIGELRDKLEDRK
ncbi:MAG: phage holin family protein [Oscillospiraceae bacterium]|nr:phage holin family protein [Oscillospiraceae bacterium]